MLSLKNPEKKKKRMLKKAPIERKRIDTSSGYDRQKINKKRSIIESSKARKRKPKTQD